MPYVEKLLFNHFVIIARKINVAKFVNKEVGLLIVTDVAVSIPIMLSVSVVMAMCTRLEE